MGEPRRVDYSRGVGQMPVIRTSGVAVAAVVAVVVRIVPDSNAGASLQQRRYASTDAVPVRVANSGDVHGGIDVRGAIEVRHLIAEIGRRHQPVFRNLPLEGDIPLLYVGRL